MKITSVEKNKKNRNKVTIYVDGKYSFSIFEEDYITLNLYEEKDLAEDEFNKIKYDIYYRSAKSTAVRFLSLKIRTEKEVRRKLSDEGFGEEVILKVNDELKSIGYINDKIFAQKFIFDRSKLKPKSKKMLKLELQSKGISDLVTDEVLESWEVDEEILVEGLIRRKFGKYDLTDEKILNKVYSFILHRGFNFELIQGVIRHILDEY
jgi:regulatory protein